MDRTTVQKRGWRLPITSRVKKVVTTKKSEVSYFRKHGYSIRQSRLSSIATKRLADWEFFQERIANFLTALQFQDVNSGHSSWLGKYQIDAVGGYDGTFLVFECKSKNQPGVKTITKELNFFSGKRAEIERAVKEQYKNKYNEIKFVLALDNIDITESEEKTAKENDIHIWGTNYLKTGEDFYSIIGPLTVHYVLKELEVLSKQIKDEEGGSHYRVPAFRVSVGGQQIYNFFIEAEKLIKLVYVFRLQPGNENAYQRFISKRRIFGTKEEPGIAQFIEDGGFFKNGVVCSFEQPVRFDKKSTGIIEDSPVEFGILNIPKVYGTIWVIDGQHRIYGYASADISHRNNPIGVAAYQDLEKRQQAKDFIDINQKQKPVDPNTIWDLWSKTDP